MLLLFPNLIVPYYGRFVQNLFFIYNTKVMRKVNLMNDGRQPQTGCRTDNQKLF
jgi:hypothetical protein